MFYKTICVLLLGGVLLSSGMEGCSNPTLQVYRKDNGAMGVRVVTDESLKVSKLRNFIHILDDLWYDTNTLIVYWWNGSITTMPTPYYLSDGTIGYYDKETKTILSVTSFTKKCNQGEDILQGGETDNNSTNDS